MDDEKIYDKVGNVIRIIPKGWIPTPLDCPVCGFAFRHMEDVMNFKMHQCCMDCDLIYRIPNKEKWDSGFRPDKAKKKEHNQHNYNKS